MNSAQPQKRGDSYGINKDKEVIYTFLHGKYTQWNWNLRTRHEAMVVIQDGRECMDMDNNGTVNPKKI